MKLNKIIAIKGEKGLFKIIKTLRQGVLLETLDKDKNRVVKNIGLSRIINLGNVAIYTKTTVPTELKDILKIINSNKDIFKGIGSKSNTEDIKAAMAKAIPNYDDSKLLPSQILKILYWYKIIAEYFPIVLEETDMPDESNPAPEVSDNTAKDKKGSKKKNVLPKEKSVSEGEELDSMPSDAKKGDSIDPDKEEVLLKEKGKRLLKKDKEHHKSEDHASIDTKATPEAIIKRPVRRDTTHNPKEK